MQYLFEGLVLLLLYIRFGLVTLHPFLQRALVQAIHHDIV